MDDDAHQCANALTGERTNERTDGGVNGDRTDGGCKWRQVAKVAIFVYKWNALNSGCSATHKRVHKRVAYSFEYTIPTAPGIALVITMHHFLYTVH